METFWGYFGDILRIFWRYVCTVLKFKRNAEILITLNERCFYGVIIVMMEIANESADLTTEYNV